MSANKIFNIQPAAITSTVATNILNCNVTAVTGPVGMTMTQPYLVVKHIRAVNNDTSSHNLYLYKGASLGAVATTALAQGQVIPANSAVDVYYGQLRLDAADFVTGSADVANKLVLFFDADIGVS